MSDPNPGSDEAVAQGCSCPRMDNCRGKGRYGDGEKYGWWMSAGCPLHGHRLEPYAREESK